MKKILFCICLAGILPASAGVSRADERHGVPFSQEQEYNGRRLVLKGLGLKRVFFMKAFVAGFYTEDHVTADSALENVPKRIEVSYFVNIPGKKLSDYTEALMRQNIPAEEYQDLQDEIAVMRGYFVDLKPGDRYALTYIPRQGTAFEYNGTVIGRIPGEVFARGLFSTWIGERPMDAHIKRKILGLVKGASQEAADTFLRDGGTGEQSHAVVVHPSGLS